VQESSAEAGVVIARCPLDAPSVEIHLIAITANEVHRHDRRLLTRPDGTVLYPTATMRRSRRDLSAALWIAGASSVWPIWLVLWFFARDTRPMKVQATILISYRADSFGEAGGALDDVLQRAREREDVEIDSIQIGTPASAGPVTLPYVERPPAPPQRVPHPLPNGERA
jgi:hypothetical protein